MNKFVKDLSDLVQMTGSLLSRGEPAGSAKEVINRLKDLKEPCEDNVDSKEVLFLKLRLLDNLSRILRVIRKQDEMCSVINSMTNIISTSVIDDIGLFISLYNSVFFVIYQEENVKLSEEIKLEVLNFSIKLINRSTGRLFQLLYDEEYAAKFSVGVLLAIQIAVNEKSSKLRKTALNFLLYAMQYQRRRDKVIQNIVGKLFMFYLPGLIGKLVDIILRDETQPHSVTVAAITCWGQLLYTVMQDVNDDDDVESVSDNEQIKKWMSLTPGTDGNFDVKAALQSKTKTKAWLRAAAHTLQPTILKVKEVVKHSHPKVRHELTVQIIRLIKNCFTTLKIGINCMLEILFSLSEDENRDVAEAAEFGMDRLKRQLTYKDRQVYLDLIEENLYSLIKKLPNVINLQDEKSILNGLQSLSKYVEVLYNTRRGRNMIFSANFKGLIRVFLTLLKFELYSELNAQDYSSGDEAERPKYENWKIFKNFTNQKILHVFQGICKHLSSIDPETIFDYLISLFNEDHSHRNEVLFIINEIIQFCSLSTENNIRKQLLDLFLDHDSLYLPLEVDDNECISLRQCHNNIITVALLLHGLGNLSIGSREFQNDLLRVLYPLIEKMGSPYKVIKTEAWWAAAEISSSVGLGNIRNLIQSNIDYLTYHITVKLRRGHPGVFDVVMVLMRNSPFEAMTNLEEIVRNVLKASSENFGSVHTVSYLRLFRAFVLCVNNWLEESGRSINLDVIENPDEKFDQSDFDSLVEYIKEKQKPKEESDDDDDDDEVQQEEKKEAEEEEYAPEKPKELPKHIELTIAVAEHALHYLPSNDFGKRLIVLEILNDSVLILADRENELLPLVHKIWSPLVTRFEQVVDPLLINRSFTLLYNLSRTSKDFIRRRTLKNVLPTLQYFLSKSAEKSKRKDSGTGYQYTQNFKLQMELLEKLPILAMHLRLSGKELDSVVECCLPYLGSLQPVPLQEKCRISLMHFKNYDPYLVWYKLHMIEKEPEYAKNVGVVLRHILQT
ncbi:UNVERIFIED_CONTAM: hypothetical protein PYX00_003144 [Menopon gallinae]|uniref:TELO2-interacting protein 1 homolog n=1 Tax=Menopon gallinae TaxID=328185 RepID=A0AAW2I0F8_9NEOP